MIRRRLTYAGVALLAAGVALFAYEFGQRPGNVHAVGELSPTNTAIPCGQASNQNAGGAGRYVAQAAPCTATATVKLSTKTPSQTATSEPSNTSAPVTQTPRPATVAPTSPSGGAGAGGVRPPNTGTGGSGGSGSDTMWGWLIAGGAALAVAGGAGIAAGALRRRG